MSPSMVVRTVRPRPEQAVVARRRQRGSTPPASNTSSFSSSTLTCLNRGSSRTRLEDFTQEEIRVRKRGDRALVKPSIFYVPAAVTGSAACSRMDVTLGRVAPEATASSSSPSSAIPPISPWT